MNQTLMQGLTEKDMQGVINTYDLKPFYFPTLFPTEQTATLSWKTLRAQAGLKIAADVVSRNASIPRKIRDSVDRIQGDIPKIAVAREMDEIQLNEYDIAVALASGNQDMIALVKFWAEDMGFCWQAVAAKIEWIALRQISQGFVRFAQGDNQSIVTEFDVEYPIDAKQKIGVKKAWSDSASTPVTDLRGAMEIAKKAGFTPKFAFLNLDTFARMAETDEVIKKSASFANVALNISNTPDLAQVNQMLAKEAWLKGLQLVIIDQDITLEKDGKRVTENPFRDDAVMLSESKVLGNTYWKTPVDMKLQGSSALKVMNGPICIKKFSKEEPVVEVTQGIANAFPAWNGSQRSILMDVKNTTFKIGQ